MPADEIGEYIDRSNFWIDTRETSDDKFIKGAFLTAVEKEAFTLLKTLVYTKTLRGASITELPARNAPVLRSRTTASDIAVPTFQSHGEETPVQRFPTSPIDATVPISQPTTPGSRSLAEVPISQPCSKPPDPKADEMAPG